MPKFEFVARNRNGQTFSGETTATTTQDAVLKISDSMATTGKGEARAVKIDGQVHYPTITSLSRR